MSNHENMVINVKL